MKPILPMILLWPLLAGSAVAWGQQEDLAKIKEQELEEVREKISALKQSMDKSASARNRVAAELQSAEVEISGHRSRLKELERERDGSARRKEELAAGIAKAQSELGEESAALGEQVRAAYMSGGQERFRLLLNQQDPATLGRMLSYYRYLNSHRAGNIAAIRGHIDELARLTREVAAEEERLAELARERYAELTVLNTAQEKRRALLATLKERISTESREVELLAQQEQDLTRLIDELTSILSDYPISSEDPFSAHKGKLTWPVAGTLLHDFGQPRVSDSLSWNGVVLAAPRGREVRAVYHGRVVFSDWLAGLGLLVIVDHGEGYMSLYGYNETTLKNAGDWVAPGDVIATVGDSGGQSRASLYFELRQGRQPLNPRHWVTRRPGG